MIHSPLRNLIAIGFEAELSLEGDEFRSSFQVLERVFWSIYCLEAGFRFFALGASIIWDPWYILAPRPQIVLYSASCLGFLL